MRFKISMVPVKLTTVIAGVAVAVALGGAGIVHSLGSIQSAPAAAPELAFYDGFDDSLAWTKLADMPFSTADQTVATVNDKFYIMGGYNNTAADPLGINYQFDPATGAYSRKADIPTKRWGPIAVPIKGLVYVFGGAQAGYAGTAVNEVYNPATNTWQAKASLPAAMANQGITGCSDGTNAFLFYNGLGYRYNVAQNSYTQLASPPQHIVSWASCSFVDGKIYLIGGWNNGGQPHTQIYTIATNSWTSGAPMPFGTYGSIRENPVIGKDIFIIQGQRKDSEFSAKAYVYSTLTNTWTEKSFGPHAADGVAGGVYDGKFYTFGGRQDITGPYGLPFATIYDPSLDTGESQWRQVTGNFEVHDGQLRQMRPLRGNVSTAHMPQIRSRTYQLPASFTLEAQSTQTAAGGSWNGLAIHTNPGVYNANLNGYLLPYNDYGVAPARTDFYKETGSTYSRLATRAAASGPQRYKIVSTPGSIQLYQNNALTLSSTDTTYRGGHINIIAGPHNTSSWDFVLVRP